MRATKKLRQVPLFPWIPLVPAALVVGALATAVGALVRIRRLEQRLASGFV